STTRPPAANPRTKVHAGTCAIERGVFGIRGPQRMPAVASTLRIVVSGTFDVKAHEPERPRGKLRIGLVLHGAAPLDPPDQAHGFLASASALRLPRATLHCSARPSAARPMSSIRKVWIEEGCISCSLCQDICPDVFEV